RDRARDCPKGCRRRFVARLCQSVYEPPPLGRRQVVRHRFLVPTFLGSNPSAPAIYMFLCIFRYLRWTRFLAQVHDASTVNPLAKKQRLTPDSRPFWITHHGHHPSICP